MEDIARVCETSSKVNHAQLVGKQDGSVVVPTYNWAEYFRPFFKSDPFKGIKQLHHLKFTADKPGKCLVRIATSRHFPF